MVTVYPAYRNYEETLRHLRALGLEGQLSKVSCILQEEWDYYEPVLRAVPTQKLENPLTFIYFGNAGKHENQN